ncbi:D-alanyl-D-alanine carboxypeptidase/D-alanyl-D-alanine-endopeptidase [bacterium]|nr:D-alanyl-D-alanine carboxypeptidase/D-alanyl-D-alanine-endopeptidase [bacterium]MCI0605540.1 D-alanyl-D-alanine carboxypeptidase/D-alanyl-D-alanine-endopeptidase [bacterium]
MNRKRIVFQRTVLALLLFLIACAKRPGESPAALPPSRDPLNELRFQLDRVLADPAFDNAFWGVAIQSMETGQILYEQNAGKLLMPASNMKLITAVTCLKKLGPDFVYETEIKVDGKIKNGALHGNLIIAGNGDPTFSSRFGEGDSFRTFTSWATRLKESGITKISGNIIAVDDAFDDERIGFGWSWDDLPYYYATETSALQFAENSITVTLVAGQPGEPVTVKMDPETSYVTVVPDIRVEEGLENASVNWSYKPEMKMIYASGALPLNGQDYGSFAIHNPAAYFASALKDSLTQNGIEVMGEAYRARDRAFKTAGTEQLLFTHKSPPLREILSILLKVSQNLYAETLLKTLGKGSFASGIQQVEATLIEMGIAPQNFIVKDGSGLSRYNYVTAKGLLQLLERMYRDPHFESFYNALAIAGVDGTLKSRMKGGSAENNIHAKTGSLSNVRSLAGYARTRDGEMVAFVLIANNYSAPSETAHYIQDVIAQQIVNFTRNPQ